MEIPYTITCDSGANLKILKRLETQGSVKIYSVMLENGRDTKKVKDKVLPIGVWGHANWDEFIWAPEDSTYNEIVEIMGKNHIKDVMHLEAHIRNKHDFFVTEDHDFLDKRHELEHKFLVRIVTPEELQCMIVRSEK